MLEQLQAIVSQKNKNKKQALDLKDKCLCAIYKGFIEKKTANQIGKEIYNLTINQVKENKFIDPNVYKSSIRLIQQIGKKLPSQVDMMETAKLKFPDVEITKSGEAISLLVFSLFDTLKASRQLTSNLNQELNKFEDKSKSKVIKDEIDINRYAKTPRVFYLSSSHNDCATDHKEYQAKIYIDEDWKQYITDKDERVLINTYINAHNIKTMQWVMGKPVWFITRPNCRHYFQAIPTNRVLSRESIKNLSKSFKTNRAIGDREYLQTLKTDKSRKVVGEIRNAQLMIQKYEERRLEHQRLYKTYKSILIKRAIQKDTQLINKWQDYIKLLEKR